MNSLFLFFIFYFFFIVIGIISYKDNDDRFVNILQYYTIPDKIRHENFNTKRSYIFLWYINVV